LGLGKLIGPTFKPIGAKSILTLMRMRKIVTKLRVVLWAMLGPTFFPRSPLIIEPKLSDILHYILALFQKP
jgi:hypothetical protein